MAPHAPATTPERTPDGTSQGTPDADRWHAAWSDALARLELDVVTAEEMLAVAHLPAAAEAPAARSWRPPAGVGSLPASLEARARELLARQLDVAERLAEAASLARRQVAVSDAVRSRPAAEPVFLDARG
ncbi:hypothetical protein [Puerhibacterium sp. TATVAM-FAB25]|uniref:hypothetical protein n=1 Tax=Puerhibacterium sp. TATVAM-FAB25 TaxID=3093699 RepID=UPI00397D394A